MRREPPCFTCAASAAGAGGLSVNFTVAASSSRENVTACVAGAARQPGGACSATSAVAAALRVVHAP